MIAQVTADVEAGRPTGSVGANRAGRDAAAAIVRYLDRSRDARPDSAARHGIG